ncbi:hypothetical protein HY839_00400 [Candidatus Azambacteria bacterium]|nr:hypothetical protein [Candidatus Azambacteria bacterium]
MAYGIRCKHCGWEESDHSEGVNEEAYHVALRRLPGRRYSLIGTPSCPGFAYSKRGFKEKERCEELRKKRDHQTEQ